MSHRPLHARLASPSSARPAPTGPSRAVEITTATILVVLALLWSVALPAPASAAEEVLVDGVPHFRNTAQPSDGVETVELEEQWRIGGEDDESVLLGIITRVLIDDEQNIYLLDQQLSEVQVISPAGEPIKTLGHAGQGPGEITSPGDMVFMPDGTLGLVQIFPGKIVKLTMDGDPAGEFIPDTGESTAGGFLALVNCRSAGGNLVLSGVDIHQGETQLQQVRTYFVRRYGMDGKMLASYIEKPVTWDFASNFKFREIDNDFIWWRMDVAPDGRFVVCEPRYGYALSVYNPDGRLERVIERDYESWTRDEKIRQRYESIMQAQVRQFPPGTEMEIEDKEQDIGELRIGPDGKIWCLPSRQMFVPEPGFFAVYDVFTMDGDFEKQVRVKCPGDSADDRLLFAGPDLAFMVTGFWNTVLSATGGGDDEEEAAPMEVICYRVK